jgi:hypothetical protein
LQSGTFIQDKDIAKNSKEREMTDISKECKKTNHYNDPSVLPSLFHSLRCKLPHELNQWHAGPLPQPYQNQRTCR